MQSFWQTLKKPIIGLAPMDGITDYPMRQIQVEIKKPDVMYTEFISVEGFSKNSQKLLKKLFYKENERPIIAQIFGYTPELYPNVIEKISKLGFDGIDINMGCPAKSVLQKGGGAALIGNFSLAEKIISNSLAYLDEISTEKKQRQIPLSIKTRIGKNEKETTDWFSFLSNFPISAVVIHGRPLSKGHSGMIDWEKIKMSTEILKKKGIIVLGNGGVKSLKEAEEKCNYYNLNGILIGQAALGNPWVFILRGKSPGATESRSFTYQPSKRELLNTILNHAKLAWDFYGEKGFSSVKKHFGWYPKGFINSKELKLSLLRAGNIEEVKKIIKDNFD